MEFFVFKFFNANKVVFDRVVNILGMIIIPLAVWFLSSVWAEFVKKREAGIQVLNSLILYSNNFLKQIISFSEIMDKKFYAIESFIENPTTENLKNAFTIIQAPTLLYALNYEPYTFTANEYPQLVDLIFKINSQIQDMICFIDELNKRSSIAIQQSPEEQKNIAESILIQKEMFNYRKSILIVLLAEMVYNRVHNFNSLYFHQNLVSISFSGYLANIIKDAYKIVDDKNKYRNPNWRDDFIDNPNSNPVKLNIKQKLYVFYLIITGKIDKLISKIRSYLTNILITKEKDDAKNLLSLYQKEDVEKLMKECTNNENRLKLCKEKYARLQISLLEDYCIWQNLFFYIDKLICNIKNIYKIFPPTKNTIITQEDSINLNMNYSFYCKTYLECLNSLINIVILHREAKELGEVKFNSNIVYQYMPPYYKNWIEHSKELQYIIYSKETYDKNLHFQFGEVINKNENTYLSNLITPQIKNIDTIPQLHPLLNCSLLELLNLIDDLYKIFYLEDEQNPDLLDKYKQERQE